MLTFLEASGAFCLFFRLGFFHFAENRKDIFSDICQVYGAVMLMGTPVARVPVANTYIDAWWDYWIIPHWYLMVAGVIVAALYAKFLILYNK